MTRRDASAILPLQISYSPSGAIQDRAPAPIIDVDAASEIQIAPYSTCSHEELLSVVVDRDNA
eukprot:2742674-Pyramimonas_sp.AAC.1